LGLTLRSRTTVRRRLSLLAAAAILPLALLAGAGLYFLAEYHEQQALDTGVELARSVANAVDTEVRGTILVLQTLATSVSLDRNDVAGFRERATRVANILPPVAAITIIDPSGKVIMDTRVREGATPHPVLDPDSLQQVIATREPAVGKLVEHQNNWFFAVRAPVLRDGVLLGVVSALVRPDAIHNVIRRQRVPDDFVISIIDQHGLRIARSKGHEQTIGGRLSESGQKIVAAGGAEGAGVSTSLEGDEIYTTYSRIEPFGWQAVLGLPTASARAAAKRSMLVFGGGVLLSILLGTFGAGWVARGITGPIGQLRDAAHALGRRESPHLPAAGLNELQDVADAMSKAAGEIQRYEIEREQLLQNERRAREAAERADRSKDEFMAVLSHELRTPLNAVFGWARLLQSSQLQDAAQVAHAHDAIVRNADAQVRLIDDLLDLSRVASGKMQLSLGQVRLAEVRQNAIDAIRPSADDKGIRIVDAGGDDEGHNITGDAARLQQIIWNLLANAVKFTGSGGEILIRQQRVDGFVEIAVSDTGQGIPKEMLPHVFDRFRQGDSSSTRSHRGLGLGLALVKDLVALHGGTVTADSRGPGLGSTFVVKLPCAADSAVSVPATRVEGFTDVELRNIVRLDGLRVLVVDDEHDARVLVETVLRMAGADVRTCGSVSAALETLAEFQPRVIISDLEMPGEDGYSLIARVRSRAPDAGGLVAAVALSAYGRPQDRVRALACGFNMHVPKPVDPGELTAIVGSVAGVAPATPTLSGYGKMPNSV